MIGQNIGNTYLFGDQSPSFAGNHNQMTSSNKAFDDMIGGALDGIEQTENMTTEYYAQWSQLKSMAKTFWKNYEIDITAPDIDNPEQMRAHNLFMKGLAAVRSMGNTLKRGAQLEDMGAEAMLRDPNIVDMGRQGEATTRERFVNTGLNDQDAVVANRVGRSVNSIQERDALNQERNEYIASLTEELNATSDPNLKRQLSQRIEGLKNVGATYDPSVDLNRRLGYYRRTAGKSNNIDFANDLWVQAKNDFLGGKRRALEFLEQIPSVSNVNYLTAKDDAGRGMPVVEVTMTGPRGKSEKVTIDLNNDREGYKNFLSVLQNLDGYKDLDVDKAVLPQELQFRAADQNYFSVVDDLRTKIGTSGGEGTLLGMFRGDKNPYEDDINNILKTAVGFNMQIPDNFDGKVYLKGADDENKTQVTDINFFTGRRTGKPFMEITYRDYNGEEETEDFEMTDKNLDEFLSYNARALAMASGRNQQPPINQQPVQEAPMPNDSVRVGEVTYTVQQLLDGGWTQEQVNEYLNAQREQGQ